MSDDVVAALNRWLDNSNDRTTAIERRVVLRARDEIVALRKAHLNVDDIDKIEAEARDGALEEAARVVEDHFNPETCGPCASAIRALKEEHG